VTMSIKPRIAIAPTFGLGEPPSGRGRLGGSPGRGTRVSSRSRLPRC
jgi:hypothetical protein